MSPEELPFGFLEGTLYDRGCCFSVPDLMTLFPRIEEELGGLSAPARLLAAVFQMVNLHPLCGDAPPTGRPREDRQALAAAFIAKAVYGCPTTRALIEQLRGPPLATAGQPVPERH